MDDREPVKRVPFEQPVDRIPAPPDVARCKQVVEWADLIHRQAHDPWGISWAAMRASRRGWVRWSSGRSRRRTSTTATATGWTLRWMSRSWTSWVTPSPRTGVPAPRTFVSSPSWRQGRRPIRQGPFSSNHCQTTPHKSKEGSPWLLPRTLPGAWPTPPGATPPAPPSSAGTTSSTAPTRSPSPSSSARTSQCSSSWPTSSTRSSPRSGSTTSSWTPVRRASGRPRSGDLLPTPEAEGSWSWVAPSRWKTQPRR